MDTVVKNRVLLKKKRTEFLAALSKQGIHETELIISQPRVTKNYEHIVGYYSSMSQFRSKLRIVVNIEEIRKSLDFEDEVETQVLMTIAHEYGHAIAEGIRFMESRDPFKVPDWKPEFDFDEEEFAEDFARYLCEKDPLMPEFWSRFMPLYAKEMERVYA